MTDQLQAIPLVTPGFKGLNKTQASVPDLDPGWAIDCQNFVIDTSGRLAARNGWAKLTVTPLSGTPSIVSQTEFVDASGVSHIISAANNHIYTGTTTLTDITGSLTITANNWQWLTFNGAVYGVQALYPLIKWTGSGNFATITPTTGSVPSGGTCGLAAFGRLWILNTDNQTISYCDLLSDVNWNNAGSGSINMATVWTKGYDTVQGIAAAGAKLVVFGSRHVVIYADSAGSVLGINPQNLYVYDTIEGTGLSARDTIQSTGEGELTWLSPTGLQSLQRLLSAGRDNPIASEDPQVRDYVNSYFVNEVPAAVRSVYSPQNRFYVLFLPSAQRAFVYDMRMYLPPDPALGNVPMRRVTEWPALSWTAICNSASGTVYVGAAGVVGSYSGYLDNTSTYNVLWTSPNFGLKPDYEFRRKILKRMTASVYYSASVAVTFWWGVDLVGLTNSRTVQFSGTLSEYNIAQYGINEYGGGAGLSLVSFPLSLTGRFVQFGMTAPINVSALAIQQLDAYLKPGNMV